MNLHGVESRDRFLLRRAADQPVIGFRPKRGDHAILKSVVLR
jgi:hypothetical protein